jgi:uncharacterized protein (DUF1810 family)
MHKADKSNLNRFIDAQEHDFSCAIAELKSGRKRSHWMWYIFPQLDGLGFSSTARFYAIRDLAEAKAYLAHPILGPRLIAATEAALAVEGKSAEQIFGHPDVLKFRSCATLFAQVSRPGSVFERVLEKFYEGKPDDQTVALLGKFP